MEKNLVVQEVLIDYLVYIKKVFPTTIGYVFNGELVVRTVKEKIARLVFFLEKHTYSQYKSVMDIYGVDYPEKKNRFEVNYNLLSVRYNSRLVVSITSDEFSYIPTVTGVYLAAR